MQRLPVLASDLDGTLLPLSADYRPRHASHAAPSVPPDIPEHRDGLVEQLQALDTLRQRVAAERLELVFVTGRHWQSVWELLQRQSLPRPNWVICDVGTSILRREGQEYHPLPEYEGHLQHIVGDIVAAALLNWVDEYDDCVLQEPEKQGAYKRSYYCSSRRLVEHGQRIERILERHRLPYGVVSSVDPFTGAGLIDLLPKGCDKFSALQWWTRRQGVAEEELVFAGDSGNDWAALTSRCKSIVVGNASPSLVRRVLAHHRQAGTLDCVYVARAEATAGVLEGCRWFGLLDSGDP